MNIRTDQSYHKILRQIQKSQQKVLEEYKQISSGKRINKSADDSAGLQVSNRLTRHTIGNTKAADNIRMGLDMLKVGDGGMNTVQDVLQRMRDLAVQSANGIYTAEQRMEMNKEFNGLSKFIDNLANTVTYNGIHVLNSSLVHSNVSPPSVTPSLGIVFKEPYVADNGNFRFRTQEGYSTTGLDDNMRLNWNADSATGSSWSRPSVIINGTQHLLQNNLSTPTVVSGTDYITRFRVGAENVDIIQTVRVVGDKFEIRYKIDNTDGVNKNIGFQFHLDTQIGSDDYAPFIVNGTNILTSGAEQEYTGASMPSEFYVYNGTVNPDIQAHGIINGAGILIPPDKFGIGTYNQAYLSGWTPDGSIGDSSYALWWNERNIASGGSLEVNTFYGIAVPPTVTPPVSPGNDGKVIIHHSMEEDARILLSMADMRTQTLGIDVLNILDRADSESAILSIDKAILRVSDEQMKFGSYMNRLEFMEQRNTGKVQGSTLSNQRIEEADIAKTTSELSANSVKLNTNFTLLQTSHSRFNSLIQLLQS